jgi:hypothetical protein
MGRIFSDSGISSFLLLRFLPRTESGLRILAPSLLLLLLAGLGVVVVVVEEEEEEEEVVVVVWCWCRYCCCS